MSTEQPADPVDLGGLFAWLDEPATVAGPALPALAAEYMAGVAEVSGRPAAVYQPSGPARFGGEDATTPAGPRFGPFVVETRDPVDAATHARQRDWLSANHVDEARTAPGVAEANERIAEAIHARVDWSGAPIHEPRPKKPALPSRQRGRSARS